MHQELHLQSNELQELQPSSRSSWTQNNLSSPLFQNYCHFQTLVQHHSENSQKQLTNYQLHQLVYSQEKVQTTFSQCQINKFVAIVVDYNNFAYTKILELENKEEKVQKKKNKKRKEREKRDSFSRSQSESECSIILNSTSISKIQQSISIYLNEAERILQYAASCGKLINRKLIITILNNQACYYQKLWELQKACSYIEASILNMEQWGQQSHWSELNKSNLTNSIEEDHFFEKVFFKKEKDTEKKLSPEFSTKVDLKYDESLLAKNYELKSKVNSKDYDLQLRFIKKKDIANHISKMCELSMYYLQYCSLCGQLSNHAKAIDAAKKVISKMKKVININKCYFLNCRSYQIKSEINQNNSNKIDYNKKKFILGLSQIQEDIESSFAEDCIENLRETARYYLKEREKYIVKECQNGKKLKKNIIQMFQKLNKTEFIQNKLKKEENQMENESFAEIERIKDQFINFTIGNILQVKPKIYRYFQSDFSSKEKSDVSIKIQSSLSKCDSAQNNNSPFSFQFIFTNALLLSTGYFTLATELRLQAAKEQMVQGERFQNKLYKQSQVYHLTAIIIISIYVPIDILYLKQLVTSYENYYVKQISPIDEMQSNQYGNGPNSLNYTYNNSSKEKVILNNNFDRLGIFPYCQKKKLSEEGEVLEISKQQQSKTKSQQKKLKIKKLKKSKSKSKSSKSKSFKKGFGGEYVQNKSQKKLDKKNKLLKNSLKLKKLQQNNDIPYISISNRPRQSQFGYKNSSSQRKKNLSNSIMIKGQRFSLFSDTNKYDHLLNNISRSTNMLTQKSKDLGSKRKYHKNSSLNSNNEKIQEFYKEKEAFLKEIDKSKKKKKYRKNSKQLKFQYKKRSEYKLNKKSPKIERSTSNMISKSKSKEKSKVKDSKNYQATEYHQRKVMSSRLPTSEHGTIIQKNHVIDQLSKRIESTKKRQQNMHSYFDDKDGKSCNKTGKKGCKKQKNQNMLLSNSLSKKGSFKSPKIMKESPKVVKQKKTVVV